MLSRSFAMYVILGVFLVFLGGDVDFWGFRGVFGVKMVSWVVWVSEKIEFG